jgi:hypothetical protein
MVERIANMLLKSALKSPARTYSILARSLPNSSQTPIHLKTGRDALRLSNYLPLKHITHSVSSNLFMKIFLTNFLDYSANKTAKKGV